MALEDRIYRATQRSQLGTNYRVDVIPRFDGELPSTPEIVDVPRGAIYWSPQQWKFDDEAVPIGFPEAPATLVTRTWLLERSDELRDLRTILTDHTITVTRSLAPMDQGYTIPVSNVIRVWSDDGSNETAWRVIWEGCPVVDQQLDPFELHLDRGALYSWKLQHISETVLRRTRTGVICAAALNDTTPKPGDEPWDVEVARSVDTTWTSADGNRHDIYHGVTYLSTYYPYSMLWLNVNRLASGIYCALTRREGDYEAGTRRLRFAGSESSDSITHGAHPWEFWHHYRQDESTAGSRGATLSRDKWAILASFRRPESGSPAIGGLLRSGKDSYYRLFPTLWDWIAAECEASQAHAHLSHDATGLLIRWGMPGVFGISHSITRDWLRMGLGTRTIPCTPGEGTINKVSVSARGTRGSDTAVWGALDTSVPAADGEWGVTLMHNSIPTWGDRAWYHPVVESSSIVPRAALINRMNLWQMYYWGKRSGHDTADHWMRVHHGVSVLPDGVAGVSMLDFNLAVTLPSLEFFEATLVSGEIHANPIESSFTALRQWMSYIIQDGGVAAAVGDLLLQIAADRRLIAYTPKLPLTARTGAPHPMDLSALGTSWSWPSQRAHGIVENDSSDWLDWFGLGRITSITPDIKADLSEVTLSAYQ